MELPIVGGRVWKPSIPTPAPRREWVREIRELEVDISDLGFGEMLAVEGAGESILICNVEGEFFALQNECTHGGVPFDPAKLRGHELECERHGARFDIRDGRALALPATTCLWGFEVERRGRMIRIRIDPA